MMQPPKDYLGDGVYAKFDGYALVLTTEDGVSVHNEIVLEPSVIAAMTRYIDRIRQTNNAPKWGT